MAFLVRPIALADAENFNRALGNVAREGRFLRLREAPPLDSSRNFIRANLENGNPQFVALDHEALVGWCDICRSTEAGSEHCGSLGIGIIAGHRGQGLGRILIEAALEAAEASFGRVELEVHAGNLPGISLYEKVGFEHEGRRRAAIRTDGVEIDILMMAKLFN